jgi:protein-tyrosine phosphatase
MKRLLFLCTGNYYRSRFAEIFFNWQAEQRNLPWRAESRGLRLENYNPGAMSHHTRMRLNRLGVPLEHYERLPIAVAPADFMAADHIVAVKETEHRPMIAARFANWLDRVEFWEVHDLDCAGPEEAISLLEREVDELMDRLQIDDRKTGD